LQGKLPEICIKIEVKCHLLRRLLGVRLKKSTQTQNVQDIKKGETLLVNVGSTAVGGSVVLVSGNTKDQITFDLFDPVCTEVGEKIALSRRIEDSWRLIGWGEILKCWTIENKYNK